MSYCVNCGVELAPSEPRCPLCGTEVVNPRKPWQAPERTPYPRTVEHIIRKVDRRYGALLAMFALLVPVLCTVLLDVLMTRSFSWSSYVVGACLCIFIWFLLPMLGGSRHSPYLYLLYDAIILFAFLFWICYRTVGIMTYLTLALPLAAVPVAFSYGFMPILLSRRLKGTLYVPAIAMFMLGCMCVVVELVLDLHLFDVFEPLWSLVVIVPCIVIGVMLILIEGKKNLKDRIRRRLFI